MSRRNRRRFYDDNHNVAISKTLSYLLRHGGREEGLNIDDQGWCEINELLNYHKFKRSNVTFEKIKLIVQDDKKGRYTLEKFKRNKYRIRANQGHNNKMSVKIEMKEIDPKDLPICIHGSYYQFWDSILKTGLSRMSRQHIHFCSGKVEDRRVKSGYRYDCEILIYIDVEKASADGFKFYESDNGVILCSGNKEGYISPEYFKEVKDRFNGEVIFKAGQDRNVVNNHNIVREFKVPPSLAKRGRGRGGRGRGRGRGRNNSNYEERTNNKNQNNNNQKNKRKRNKKKRGRGRGRGGSGEKN